MSDKVAFVRQCEHLYVRRQIFAKIYYASQSSFLNTCLWFNLLNLYFENTVTHVCLFPISVFGLPTREEKTLWNLCECMSLCGSAHSLDHYSIFPYVHGPFFHPSICYWDISISPIAQVSSIIFCIYVLQFFILLKEVLSVWNTWFFLDYSNSAFSVKKF